MSKKIKHSSHRSAPVPLKRQLNYMTRNEATVKQMLLDAYQEGMQRAVDMFECVLHDPEIMGKNTLGEEKMCKVVRAAAQRDDYYDPAFGSGVEADVKRDELDRELRAIHGDKLFSFAERYPNTEQFDYSGERRRKDWVGE